MSKNKDGGPAFPVAVYTANRPDNSLGLPAFGSRSHDGMSLRDAFALAALQSLASAAQDETLTGLEDRAADTARACYTIADAMLKAREQ